MNPETNKDIQADCAALIVSAGRGARFGTELPKQYQELGGATVIRRAIQPFLDHPRMGAVRTVIHGDDLEIYRTATEGLELLEPVPGGPTRQDSVRLGLESLAGLGPRRVLIHDAARPLVSPQIIDGVIKALDNWPGAIPALALSDSLKRGMDGRISEAVEREGLWRAQTPQGFHFPEILRAHQDFAYLRLTDDAALAEAAGLPVALIDGDEDNLKVTTPDDLDRAARLAGLAGGAGEMRVGSGFDVHRFGPGDHVILGGISIPHDQSLMGHSDADVALHALTDALLGALGQGNIGSHFPPDDEEWRGASSEIFLRHAGGLVQNAGARIVNLDLTLICEQPKIAPHRTAMRQTIGRMLELDVARISVKGTTTERLGFTGRGEGIAAQAVVSIQMK